MREFILSIEKQIPPDSLYDLKSAARMPSYSENQSSRTVWGGAQTSISAIEYLPENYHIHICGWGNEEDEIEVRQMISDLSAKSKAIITYDGLKKGDEFIEFLQKCHIGLSTQNPEGEYNDTSFPSKVLTYMANGLAVISIKIPVLENAAIADVLSFYDVADGKALAEAIQNADISDNREIVKQLDSQFKKQIKNILNN